MAAPPKPPSKRTVRKTLNATNLSALGEERLADLLMEFAEAQPAIKRRLRMELAGEVGAAELGDLIARQLAAVETRRSRVHRRKYKVFVGELDQLRELIAGRLAELDPTMAHGLLWRLLRATPRLHALMDDPKGLLHDLARGAVEDLGRLAGVARPDPRELAEAAFELLKADTTGSMDGLVSALLPVLGSSGTDELATRLTAHTKGRSWMMERFRSALQEIADYTGDVDAWIAAVPEQQRKQPGTAAAFADRLLAAGRTAAAVEALDRAAPQLGRCPPEDRQAWEGVFIDALEAAGRLAEAQRMRWAAFERDLSADRLREHLRRLPDFDDVEAEERALDFAASFPRIAPALAFLLDWPSLHRAAALITSRAVELVVSDAAAAHEQVRRLESRYPLAASLLLRGVIAHAVRRQDRPAVERLLQEAASLAEQVDDFSPHEPHRSFEERVRRSARL